MRTIEEVLAALEADYVGLFKEWREFPDIWCEDILRSTPLPWQRKLMRAIARAKLGLPNEVVSEKDGEFEWGGDCKTRFAVKSGTGVGKTFTVTSMILWMLSCFPDAKVPCTAPSSNQIKAVLWPEINKLVNKIPAELAEYFPFDVQTDKVTFYKNFAVARTAREERPESFQGFHAKNIMLVGDEASGIPDPIYMAGQGIMSEEGAITLLIGNPTRPTGYFFDTFHSDSHKWWTLTVSCTESARVSKAYVRDMREKHGENSYEFKVRVMGEFHLEDSGIIIPRPWVTDAVERDVSPDSDWIVWGVDVSDGRDKSALAKRCGNTLLEPVKSWGGKEIMQSVGIIVDEYFNCGMTKTPDEICVDAIGMGAAFAGRLQEALRGEPVKITRVNVALTGSQVNERYTSRRVELWGRARGWFESGLVRIPQGCGELIAQLCGVEWEVKDSNGKWALIDKKGTVGHSPDQADAFLLTFGGVKGAKSTFTKEPVRGILRNNTHSNEYAITSASYLRK